MLTKDVHCRTASGETTDTTFTWQLILLNLLNWWEWDNNILKYFLTFQSFWILMMAACPDFCWQKLAWVMRKLIRISAPLSRNIESIAPSVVSFCIQTWIQVVNRGGIGQFVWGLDTDKINVYYVVQCKLSELFYLKNVLGCDGSRL